MAARRAEVGEAEGGVSLKDTHTKKTLGRLILDDLVAMWAGMSSTLNNVVVVI